jgi:hypothetical protein
MNEVTKRRKDKHFQFLTEEIWNVHLKNQIKAATALLRATPDGDRVSLELYSNHAFPQAQGDLFASLDVERLLDE